MERGEPQRRSDLPAPYRSPWSGLADSLRAVAADLRLALRRLWRRNLEGDLPRPPFWPEGLAALFWPLLVSLVLVLAVMLVTRIRSTAPVAPTSSPPSALDPAAPLAPAAAGASVDGAAVPVALAPLLPSPSTAERPAEGQFRTRAAVSSSPASSSPASAAGEPVAGGFSNSAASPPGAPPPELQLDPLLALLSEGEDAGLLLAARPDPLHGLLILTLSPAAEALPEHSLQAQADRWQQRAREAGYDRLELRDRIGHLRGRDALVGSGMILLASPPPA